MSVADLTQPAPVPPSGRRSEARAAVLRVLALPSDAAGMSVKAIMSATGIANRKNIDMLVKMVRAGEIVRVGWGKYALPAPETEPIAPDRPKPIAGIDEVESFDLLVRAAALNVAFDEPEKIEDVSSIATLITRDGVDRDRDVLPVVARLSTRGMDHSHRP